MNDKFDLEEKVKYITEYVKNLNEYMSGKSEEDFRKDGVTPLEQHLMSIQLMSLTSAMIAMNDRLAILRNKNPSNSEAEPVVETTPIVETQPEVNI